MKEGKNRTEAKTENRRADGPSFPLRVACIDTGSNAIRFLAGEFTDPFHWQTLHSSRAPVRLGHGVFLTGKLTQSTMDAAVEAFQEFRTVLDEFEITHCRAVATSAVRESSNGQDFIDRVMTETGIAVEMITGSEEARLVHVAISSRIVLGKKPWLLTDLGGGSVEVSLVDDSGILWSESHTMGSVRLLEELSESEENPGRFRRVLSEYVATLRIPSAADPAGLIATGGNIEALARLVGVKPDDRGVSRITVGELRGVIDSLARLSYRDRVEQLMLRSDRADVILPAAMVYERVAKLAEVDVIHVPEVGVKEGVLLDTVDELTSHRDHEERRAAEIADAAVNLGRRYFFDESHARHVAEMAGTLFDQLRPVHELKFRDRRLLTAAALLHDIGSYISRKKHHRHSHYLISQSEIGGLPQRDVQMVATVARFHRKQEPFAEHEAMESMDENESRRITAMTALLRVADGLDREHRQHVRSVHARIKKDTVILEVDGEGDLLLERTALKKRSHLFERTFDMDLKIRSGRE